MSKYDNLSKEELLRVIEKQEQELEQELKQKKYGLVWDAEREPEQVVLDCANNLPVLKRVKGKEIKTDDRFAVFCGKQFVGIYRRTTEELIFGRSEFVFN